MISSGHLSRAAAGQRSICIHSSYGIKYTRHVHESDNCQSRSAERCLNQARFDSSRLLPFLLYLLFTPLHYSSFVYFTSSQFYLLSTYPFYFLFTYWIFILIYYLFHIYLQILFSYTSHLLTFIFSQLLRMLLAYY